MWRARATMTMTVEYPAVPVFPPITDVHASWGLTDVDDESDVVRPLEQSTLASLRCRDGARCFFTDQADIACNKREPP